MPIRRRAHAPKKLFIHRQGLSIQTPPSPETPGCSYVYPVRIKNDKPPVKYGFPKALADAEITDIVVGMLYNRRKGYGPGQGYSAWVCENIVWWEKQSISLAYTRKELSEPPRLRFIGSFEPKFRYEVDDHAVFRPWPEIRLEDKAYQAILDEYEDIHDVMLPSYFPGKEVENN